MRSTVLTDDDVRRVLPMSAAVDRIESALREHAEGTMVAPPRFRVDVAKGALTCIAGAVTHDDQAVGCRVYDRFQESPASHGQVVVVFDSDTGDCKGVIVGGHLGAMRTGAIGGVGLKHQARVRSQLAQTRRPRQHRRAPGLGRERSGRQHRGSVRVVATDSRRQLRSDATPYVLAETLWMEAMVELGEMVVGQHTGRHSPEDMTLFCTAGLSGTEVAVASEALRRAGHREGR
jgi:ornithine cyclodeaminase/alanine dehydrogenase-like protein (mu-crystallin family)